MPIPHSKTRAELKARFVRGAIPTEADFCDLIDAGLNQAEDGVIKRPGEPLGIVRLKPSQSVLRFFEDPAGVEPAWQVNLASSAKNGFVIANQGRQPCMYIDKSTGNVGVGTDSPSSRLTVVCDDHSASLAINSQSKESYGGQVAIISSSPQLDFVSKNNSMHWSISVNCGCMYFVNSPWEYSNFVLNGNTGNIGIGTDSPKWKLDVDGSASISTLQAENIYVAGKQLKPSMSYMSILPNGNVGICEKSPNAKLTIFSDVPVEKTSKDPESTLSYGGHMTIKAPTPQLDFIDQQNQNHWAINLSDGKLSFVRSPWNSADLVLDKFGNVGIGTAEPRLKLDVAGTVRVERLIIGDKWLLSGGRDAGIVEDLRGSTFWLRVLSPNLHTYHHYWYSSDREDVYYGGLAAMWLCSSEGRVQGSDLRLKDASSIRPVENILSSFLALAPVQFHYKNDPPGSLHHYGFIAQDVEAICPAAIETGPDGMKGIDTSCLIALLVQAVKEQQAEINLLQAQFELALEKPSTVPTTGRNID
jgi:hypothetical protein